MEKHEEWKTIRSTILRRDGYRCAVFGCKVRGSTYLSVHHIIPRPQGGNNPENLITLCNKHHDEIELAEVKAVELIRNWTGLDDTSHGKTCVSRTILDVLDDDVEHDPVFDINHVQQQHLCADSTVEAITAIKDGRSWVDVANVLRYEPSFAPTLSQIAGNRPGAISIDGEEELRERLGLARLSDRQYMRCAACGHAHHPSCDCLTFAFGVAPTPRQIKQRRHVPIEERKPSRTYVARQDTVSALLEAKGDLSWRALSLKLGYESSYSATLNRIARGLPGALPRAAENDLRQRLGLPPRARRRYFRPCLPVELRGAYEAWRSEQ